MDKPKKLRPKLAMCNFVADSKEVKRLAMEHGFHGIDWSFTLDTLPSTPAEESHWVKCIAELKPLEIRYHCPFYQTDLGHDDPREAADAAAIFQRIIRIVSKTAGKFLTIHIGLGHDSTEPLSWNGTIKNLRDLVAYGANRGVTLCLENLAWGWTSKPHLFEKLVRGSGAGVTFDVGHAWCCESVRSQYFDIEDFVIPHSDRVFNAHVYDKEVANLGHTPPDSLETIVSRLNLLRKIGCSWWTLEVRDKAGLLQTKRIVDEYLTRADDLVKPLEQGLLTNRVSHG